MLKTLILLFLLWRIALLIPLLASQSIEYRQGYPYTSPLYFLENKNSVISHFLISPWANFDGVYYLQIAAGGYTINAGFFPLLPLSIHLATIIFGNVLPFDPIQYFTALLLVSFFFLLSLFILYKLLRLDYKNDIVIWTIILILVFPTSFFFASIYSESLFLLLSLSSFYFARKKRWFLSSFCVALLTATRIVGVAIIPVLIYEFIKSDPSSLKLRRARKILLKNVWQFLARISPLFASPMGLLIYMWFNLQKWGSAFYFIAAQGNFQNNRTVDSIVFIPQTIFRYFKILTTVSLNQFEWWIALLEISVFVFIVVMLYIAYKKRVRLSYIVFSILALFIPASTGTFSGLPRYSLALFPIFIALALVKNKFLKISYSLISATLLFLLFMLFARGYYIA